MKSISTINISKVRIISLLILIIIINAYPAAQGIQSNVDTKAFNANFEIKSPSESITNDDSNSKSISRNVDSNLDKNDYSIINSKKFMMSLLIIYVVMALNVIIMLIILFRILDIHKSIIYINELLVNVETITANILNAVNSVKANINKYINSIPSYSSEPFKTQNVMAQPPKEVNIKNVSNKSTGERKREEIPVKINGDVVEKADTSDYFYIKPKYGETYSLCIKESIIKQRPTPSHDTNIEKAFNIESKGNSAYDLVTEAEVLWDKSKCQGILVEKGKILKI